jgi:hypothetical protein
MPKETNCKYCNEKIVLIKNHKGHLIPVESISEGDTEFDETKHIKHKPNCKGAKK